MKARGWRLPALVLLALVFGLSAAAQAGGDYSLEEVLRDALKGGHYQRHLTGAKYRLAVFSFDDPQETGRGDDAALIMARHILIANSYLPIGVLNFKQKLSPAEPGELSYFDKVELVMKGEQVTLAVWGRVLPLGESLVIDTFLQIPEETLENRFNLHMPLPQSMGGGIMQAHLRPDRIHVQRLILDKAQQKELADSVKYVRELRAAPRFDAKVSGVMPPGKNFQIDSKRNGWVQLRVSGGGPGGWVLDLSLDKHPLFAAASFSAAMFQLAAKEYVIFEDKADLTLEARAVADQLKLFNRFPDKDQSILSPWLSPGKQTSKDSTTGMEYGGGNPPGGAAFANLRAMSDIAEGLWNYGRTRLDKGFARQEIIKAFHTTLSASLPKNQADKISRSISQKSANTKSHLTEGELKDFMSRQVRGELEKALGSDKAWDLYAALERAAVSTLYDGCRLEPGSIRTMANQLAQASLDDPSNVDVLHNLALLFNYLGDTDRKALAESLAAHYAGTK